MDTWICTKPQILGAVATVAFGDRGKEANGEVFWIELDGTILGEHAVSEIWLRRIIGRRGS